MIYGSSPKPSKQSPRTLSSKGKSRPREEWVLGLGITGLNLVAGFCGPWTILVPHPCCQ